MKIALAQLDYRIGDFERNTAKIIAHIQQAKAEAADLVVFAELAVCGYPPRDFLEFKDFISLCGNAINEIAVQCVGIAAIVGAPSENPASKGKPLFNSAYFLKDGRVAQVVHKSLLPNYDIFDEYRYFEPNRNFACIELKGKKIALTICEDLWNIDDDPLYIENPMAHLMAEKPDFAINIAASPFSYTHDTRRTRVLQQNAFSYQIPFFNVNHTGAQTELVFDGCSTVVHPSGNLIKMKDFEEEMRIFDLNDVKHGVGCCPYIPCGKEELIYKAIVEGIRGYFGKLGFKKAVLGLSGGIDSAVVLALASQALGAENILAVMMPSPYSSGGSLDDSKDMIAHLGVAGRTIPIQEAMVAYSHILEPVFEGLKPDLTEENIQARIRGATLMALSNKLNHIVLNTSNKSEFAVGYSTLYGDGIGAISVLGDVYKTEVYELAGYINKVQGNVIPDAILKKEPSAELRPGQRDMDSLPPYHLMDAVLFQYIENRFGPNEITAMGYDQELVYRICKMVNQSEYKRFQAPPIIRVSNKAFGSGRRMPLVAKYLV